MHDACVYITIFLAVTITFEQPTYSIIEDLVTVRPVLTFSNPSQADITVQVINTDISTSGKYILILFGVLGYCFCSFIHNY